MKQFSFSKSYSLLEYLVARSHSAVVVLDSELRVLIASDRALARHGITKPVAIDISYEELFPLAAQVKYACKESLSSSERTRVSQQITLNGMSQREQLTIYPWQDEADRSLGLVVFSQLQLVSQDSDRSTPGLSELAQSKSVALEPFFELSLDFLAAIDFQGCFQRVNPAFSQVLGYSEAELKQKPTIDLIHPEDRAASEREIENLRLGIPSVRFENRYRCRDGSYRYLQWMAASSHKENCIYAVARDVTLDRNLTQQLAWQSRHDHLTSLPNRREFERQIVEIVRTKATATKQHIFCYLDLDRFRVINDLCGHVVGDELLRQVASLLQRETGDDSVVFRLGGDEFGILLRGYSLEEAEIFAHKIRLAIKDSLFQWQDTNHPLGVSIGIVEMNQETRDFSSLLNAADIACAAAKEQGRNWIRVYSPQDRELVKQRGEKYWIAKLNSALEQDQFRLYCQKIAPLQDEQGSNHYEILLRLFDENGSLIPPMEFIPAAERYDLMPSIDRWVIANFFDSYEAHCQEHGYQPDGTVYTINLSGASINSDRFFAFLKQQFAFHNISPQRICFEITETVTINNLNKAARFIREIKDIGCSFALDDFGSGASSFNYLKNLPVDYLKIDGHFVKNMVHDLFDRTTVEFFNRLSKMRNIQTIAEFVENDAIISQLKEIGINYAQGYGIDKPAPLSFPSR